MINRRKFVSQSLAVVSLGLTVPSVFGKALSRRPKRLKACQYQAKLLSLSKWPVAMTASTW